MYLQGTKRMQHTLNNYAQDALAATASGGFTIGWLAQANQVLQAMAFVVAIISGSIVIYRHFKGKKQNGSKTDK